MATAVSFQQTEQELRTFKSSFSPTDIPFIIMKAFGKTDADIRRYKSGKGIVTKFEGGLLIKGLLAYRPAATMMMDETLNKMKRDISIVKAAPRILMVSDGERILAYNPKEQETYENPLSKLWIDFQFFYPLCGIERYRGVEENPADVKAAEKMAKLHDEIRAYNEFSSSDDLHDLNIFMTRLLFCYFAEDTGIFEDNLFTGSIVRYTRNDGSDLSDYLATAFEVMDKPVRIDVPSIFAQFPYVNGGLFSKRINIPKMGLRARKLIVECGELNWKDINPDIFGSMIQAVVSPSQRGSLGMHYTSVPNIMKVIQPLFLDDLYEAYSSAKDNVKKLRQLLVRISKMKFFDPACGSGNFLIIAYKELRKLEIQIWKRIAELSGNYELPFVNIQLTQFYGIEIDDFAQEVASLSLRLAEHQMNNMFTREFANVNIPALPLGRSGNIVHGNACRVDWNTVCPHTKEEEVFVFGNPPYLGSRNQEESHKKDMSVVLHNIPSYKRLDYIANWFYKGYNYIIKTKAQLAFVSTNSICQGEQLILWGTLLKSNVEIGFAYKTFNWTNNAKGKAGVSVIIINLRNKEGEICRIYEDGKRIETSAIAPNLSDENKYVLVAKQTKSISNLPEMRRGNMPNDKELLRLSVSEKEDLLNQFPTASIFVRRQIGSEEYIKGLERYCLWISDERLADALSIPFIKERVEAVRHYRLNSKDKTLHEQANRAHQFREFFECGKQSLLIPIVSSGKRKYIPMGFVGSETIVPNSAQVVYEANMFLFGILTSLMHNCWVKVNAGRMRSDFRYSIFLCYNTFPFPKIGDEKKREIEEAAEEVLLVREDYPGKTLADLYDPDKMPDDLREAHHRLDLIVEGCYQDKPFANDEERLECLFRLYEKMSKK